MTSGTIVSSGLPCIGPDEDDQHQQGHGAEELDDSHDGQRIRRVVGQLADAEDDTEDHGRQRSRARPPATVVEPAPRAGPR